MLRIKKILQPVALNSVAHVNSALSENETFQIAHANWEEFPYKPDAAFQIGHDDENIYLKYMVSEKNLRAKYTEDFGDVWTDSCVEFFISAENDKNYYNFEFNCIGTSILCYGPDKHNREKAPAEIMSKIIRFPSLGKNPISNTSGHFEWELLTIIPSIAFFRNQISSLSGLSMKANFYKCGDELDEPHFLTWVPVNTNTPDFHRPEFFGEVYFE